MQKSDQQKIANLSFQSVIKSRSINPIVWGSLKGPWQDRRKKMGEWVKNTAQDN